ncbi:bzip transcription factor [Niveomyces insectorum RCEF 264]|uniref:Bzip transcription factor n=1 Tax=Niveomyces insectorum RCEF 264 TaxID=1081102 RepID=A0A167TSY0_9HYPO|nr:bzip transcription factor [Niveomyces insectorum RCEF 264]
MAFNGRRGPNISQFLRELHENPTLVDSDPAFSMDDQDLSMFTNTEFFDLETGQNTDFQPPAQQPTKPSTESVSAASTAVSPLSEDAITTTMADFTPMDFMTTGDFNFPDFNAAYSSPSITSYQDNLGNLHQPIQPGPQPVYSSSGGVGHAHGHATRHNGFAGASQTPPRIAAAEKRKPDALNPATRAITFEEQTRVAAEEDKRRRNTAASARFRIKKKQREQALEKSAKEMTEKVTALEGRIQQLETENKWLKSIVLEKNAGNEEFLGKLLEDFKSKHANAAQRNGIDIEADAAVAAISDEENETRDSSG